MTRWLRCAREGPRPTCRDHSKSTALDTVLSTEHANYTSGRALSRRWPESRWGASEVVPSPNGAPKRALPRGYPHAPTLTRACDGNRLIAARRTRRAGRGSCARVSVRAQSADEYEPSWAHWLPQQPTQSRLKGSRQARAEQVHAHSRDTVFEGSKPAAHLLKPSKCRTARVTQGGNEPPTTQQAGWPPTREESELWSGSAQCNLGVMQCANSVQGQIMPCACSLRRTQPGPCHST